MRVRAVPMRNCILPFVCLLILALQGCSSVPGFRSWAAGRSREAVIAEGAQLLAAGKRVEALKLFDRALARAPDDVELAVGVVGVLWEGDLYEESIPYVERAIQVPPSGNSEAAPRADELRDSELYRLLGHAYLELERIEEAEDAYRRAVALNARNASAYNDWGYMYADLGVKLDEALRLTKRAVDMQPNTGEFLDSLGWTYYRMGDFREAADLLRRAVALSPSDAEIRYHMGMAHERLGDVDAALIEYRKALLIEPSHEAALQRIDYLRRKQSEKKQAPFPQSS